MRPLSQTQHLFFFRKPAGVPATRGKTPCFLDDLKQGSLDSEENIANFPHFIDPFQTIQTMIGATGGDVHEVRTFLLDTFSAGEEYGLLNRLDTDTSGMLYFARSREVYEQWRHWQDQGGIEKHYLAQVHGDIVHQCIDVDDPYCTKRGNDDFVLRFPVMHHRFDSARMVSCRTPAGKEKLSRQGKGHVLDAETIICPLSYDPTTMTSIVHVKLHHGRRHQIRLHFATFGYPLVGDVLYGKTSGTLQLVSVGCRLDLDVKNVELAV